MRSYRQAAYLIMVIIGLMLLLFFINQTTQVVYLANSIHAAFGRFTLYALLTLYACLLILPILWMVRLPRRPLPPGEEEGPAYDRYMQATGKRLQSSPWLKDTPLDVNDHASIKRALSILDQQADQRIKNTAKRVFVATAISQYGRLDGLIVLVTQVQMIWQVMAVYHQRPALSDIASLYLNVGGTAFMATEMGDMNIVDEHVEAVFAPILGSSMLPGAMVTVIGNSLIQGAANAFLTLRIGVIARGYCAATTSVKRSAMRRSALAQAAVLLGTVVGEASGAIVSSLVRAAGRTGMRTVRASYDLAAKGVKGATRGRVVKVSWPGIIRRILPNLKSIRR